MTPAQRAPGKRQQVIYILHKNPYERAYLGRAEAREALRHRVAGLWPERNARGQRLFALSHNLWLEVST